MKCPKCSYLGFETGDRCKNCGYDFSLIDHSLPDDVEIDLTLDLPVTEPAPATPAWGAGVDLPLFTPAGADDDDAPLIKLPTTPRPPLAVRKTPEIPRLRAVPRTAPRASAEPVLEFAELPDEDIAPPPSITPTPDADVFRPARARAAGSSPASAPGAAGARLAAAALDHLILA